MDYKIKTKDIKPKMYSIIFTNNESKLQALEVLMAYSFEDAVAVGRMNIAKNFNINFAESLKFIPVLYRGIDAEEILKVVVEGKQDILSDENQVMKDILEEPELKKAEELLEKNKHILREHSIKFIKEELKKKHHE